MKRWTNADPCPICNGCDRMERGQGKRCFGFLSSDGKWAYCSRDEYAGSLEINLKCDCYPHHLEGSCRCGITHGEERAPISTGFTRRETTRESRGTVESWYDYRDETGTLLYQVVRFNPKGFAQRAPKVARPDPHVYDHWTFQMTGVRRVLYRLPDLQKSGTVHIVEGEKSADLLASLGLLATCSSGGAGKWHLGTTEDRDSYAESLLARDVVILPDNDNPGYLHARMVGRALLPLAERVRIVRLPNLPKKGDVYDWLHSYSLERLQAMINATPLYRPEPPRECLCGGTHFFRDIAGNWRCTLCSAEGYLEQCQRLQVEQRLRKLVYG